MARYILERIGQAILTLFALSVAVFLSVHVTGDPLSVLLGQESTPEDAERLRKALGLDRPLPVQYVSYLAKLASGDLGRSLVSGQPVLDLLLQRLPYTFQLALTAFVLMTVVGVTIGVACAVKRDSLIDRFGKLFAVLGIATPSFWVGIMLIFFVGGMLRWLPTNGAGGLEHLVMPAFVVGWHGMAGMVRLVRSSMLEVLDSEYVKFARIKGLSERLVIYKHALRNAAIPAVTFGGLSLAGLLNGSVVVEVVFGWPGVGRFMLQGISQRDVAMVQAGVLSAGFFYVALALAVDILYVYVDPRIRYR